MRLTACWSADNLTPHDPCMARWANALTDAVKKREHEWAKIGFDTKMPADPKRRFWQRVPNYSTVSRAVQATEPRWRIGYNDRELYLMVDFPDYEVYRVRNQSVFEYRAFGEPKAYKSLDSERQERAVYLLNAMLESLGLHHHGPNPPDGWDWQPIY